MDNTYTVRLQGASDAEYKEAEQGNTYPVKFGSLPVMLDKERLERIRHDIELNNKLNLSGQNTVLAKQAVVENLEQVMAAKHDYPEVDKDGLLKLFQVFGMRKLIWLHNMKQTLKTLGVIVASIMGVVGALFLLSSLPEPKDIGVTHLLWIIPCGVLILFFGIACLSMLCMAVAGIFDTDIPWFLSLRKKILTLKLSVQDIERTTQKIPYGAKLRLEEAMDLKLFSGFYYVEPTVARMFKDKPVDPAIIGHVDIDGEEKWYLICAWDIEKDKQRVVRDLNNLMKMKAKKI